MKLRSLLYIPAHVERFVAKAHQRGADAIILDLEDAVPEGSKDAARDALSAAVPLVRRNGARVYVRVNATDRLAADVRAALAAGADGVMLPKAGSREDVDRVISAGGVESGAPFDVIAIIETAAAMLDARAVAAHPRVSALCLGAEDFATDTGGRPEAEVLRLPKLMVHYAAKAEGKLSLGLLRSVAQFNDETGLTDAAEEAARFGFDGASCIHPKVVPILTTAFTPPAEAVDWARRVIAAADTAAAEGRGAFLLDGVFIDAPIVTRAKATLAKAGLE